MFTLQFSTVFVLLFRIFNETHKPALNPRSIWFRYYLLFLLHITGIDFRCGIHSFPTHTVAEITADMQPTSRCFCQYGGVTSNTSISSNVPPSHRKSDANRTSKETKFPIQPYWIYLTTNTSGYMTKTPRSRLHASGYFRCICLATWSRSTSEHCEVLSEQMKLKENKLEKYVVKSMWFVIFDGMCAHENENIGDWFIVLSLSHVLLITKEAI